MQPFHQDPPLNPPSPQANMDSEDNVDLQLDAHGRRIDLNLLGHLPPSATPQAHQAHQAPPALGILAPELSVAAGTSESIDLDEHDQWSDCYKHSMKADSTLLTDSSYFLTVHGRSQVKGQLSGVMNLLREDFNAIANDYANDPDGHRTSQAQTEAKLCSHRNTIERAIGTVLDDPIHYAGRDNLHALANSLQFPPNAGPLLEMVYQILRVLILKMVADEFDEGPEAEADSSGSVEGGGPAQPNEVDENNMEPILPGLDQ
ncbi:hypothetical protein SISSUDRAFT_1036774 [Sistotremastrum suecicum HHB10207 ss-3]|uniref:Uncharacterized protein n=1 Tax=Sistotremastrum suecicum HHB10207 ss-3 TaxID=1314776 RepID=A0A165Z0R6_9AGAM|nr:hypothetical protein SISSUDRAFT_1036774 [Sistotremastrum suecicum HHB10207 ss-3]